ncbi:hypothetical protein CJ030_MR8G004372 [Morella rubra]|uniref:Uncharacterized protein n=1 Tax=Morella rubra TaxID=262757 RepID=A0A6A1UNR8_9ROSI|nr:hypothetical protein CJ030_MR8G004372 [Morella rubra]
MTKRMKMLKFVKRGATRMAEVWNLEEGELIPNKRFVIPEGPMGDVVKRRFFKDLGEKWRNHKCALKERHFDEARTPQEVKSRAPSNVNLDQFYNLVDFWFSATGRDRSQRGKQSRSLQTSLHTGGSRSFARHAYEMVNRDAQNVAHPEQVPSIPRSAHASTNDLGATLDGLSEIHDKKYLSVVTLLDGGKVF